MRAIVRSGFTLIEMVVAMALTLVVFAITLPFVRTQSQALGGVAGRLDADQIARYAVRAIDRDLRLAGSDPGQPLLVYAGPMGISFNANLLARDTLDPGAAAVELGAATSLTEAWRVADASVLPLTSTTYPTTNYTDADGALSRVETISYFLRPDTVTSRNDIYALYRRVNARDSVLVVRGLQVPAGSAFFRYLTVQADTFAQVPAGSLPMFWTSTGIQGVRGVEIQATGYFFNAAEQRAILRGTSGRTLLVNAVAPTAVNCGAAPLAPSNVQQSLQTTGAGYFVRVTWNASGDDGSGANDVRHYVLNLRPNTNPVTWQAVAVVPATGASSYRFEHHLSTTSGSIKYGVHAVDCGSAMSSTVEHNSNLAVP